MASDETKKPGPPRLALDTPTAARRSIARLCRMRFRGELASDVFRDLVYALSTLRSYDALLADLRIEERLDEIEERLTERDRRAGRAPLGPGAVLTPPAPRRLEALPADAIRAEAREAARHDAEAPRGLRGYVEPAADAMAARGEAPEDDPKMDRPDTAPSAGRMRL